MNLALYFIIGGIFALIFFILFALYSIVEVLRQIKESIDTQNHYIWTIFHKGEK